MNYKFFLFLEKNKQQNKFKFFIVLVKKFFGKKKYWFFHFYKCLVKSAFNSERNLTENLAGTLISLASSASDEEIFSVSVY